jgi:hypothetical protein
MKRLLLIVALLASASTASANLVTWNLAGTSLLPQETGTPASFSSGGQTLEARSYKLNGSWAPAITNQNVLGLGAWTDKKLLGDLLQAQLDNIGTIEILQLKFPLLTAPVASKLTLAITDDDYTIWGNNTGALPTGATIIGDILARGKGSGLADAFMKVEFNAGLLPYQYVFFSGKSVDGVLQSSCSFLCGDGYRVKTASAQVVPIPAALPLFLSAFAGVVLVSRRRTT